MVDVSSRKNSITIKVESTNKKNSITATTDTARYSVSTSSDTAKYWSELSGQYANQAKLEAEKSEQYANQASEIHEDIVELKDDSISAINQAKNEGVSTITDLVNESVQEYEDIAEGIRQNNSETSDLARQWATSDVIVENIDYSSKYYAQLSQESAREAINIASTANAKSDIAVNTANESNVISNNAMNVANQSNTIANNAMEIANIATDNVEQFRESIDIVLDSANKIKEIEDAVQLAVDSAELANQASENAIEAVDNVINSLDSKADKTEIKNGKLTIQANGSTVATFTANQEGDSTANIVIPDSAQWGKITGTLSNQSDLQTALNTKANDSAVVHKTGNETIAGDKTFSNTIKAEHGKFGKILTTYRYKSNETPTTTYYWYKIFQSSTSSQCVNFEIMAHSDNNYPQFAKYTISVSNYNAHSTSIVVYNHGKIGATPSIKVALDADGNVYLQANCIWDCVLTANNVYGTATVPYTNMGYGAFGTPIGFTSIGMITSTGAIRYLKTTGAVTYSTPEIDALATKATADASGNTITSTYRKISDSYTKTDVYNKTEVDNIIKANKRLDLFDTVLKDHILTYEESKGLALQGTYVYKDAIAGSRYGYPDFYNKVLQEYNQATTTETVNGVTVKVHSNGHKFYDIANKTAIDEFFNTMGTAWFYGVDTANERIFLPRNKWFIQPTDDVSKVNSVNEAGLPNITGSTGSGEYFDTGQCSPTGAFTKRNETRASRRDSYAHTPQSGFNFDASLSSPIYGNSDTVQPQSLNQLLYICVGNTTSYEGLTDVVNQGMEILEQVNQGINNAIVSRVKLDGSNAQFPYITESYVNGTSGYRIWSDKYCEQWGLTSALGGGATISVSLLKSYVNTNYNITLASYGSYTAAGEANDTVHTLTTSSFIIASGYIALQQKMWKTCGYIK